MSEKRWLYFALGVTTVISIGAVTNQLVPLAPSGVAVSDSGITFPDGTVQVTAGNNADPPCFNTTQRFVDCGNGTVTDTATGRVWLEDVDCFAAMSYPAGNDSASALAEGQCNLTDGSRPGDWRLPAIEEWEALVKPSCPTPPKIAGPGTGECYSDDPWASDVDPAGTYWSSTTLTDGTNSAFRAILSNGSVDNWNVKTAPHLVWPVRSGQ